MQRRVLDRRVIAPEVGRGDLVHVRIVVEETLERTAQPFHVLLIRCDEEIGVPSRAHELLGPHRADEDVSDPLPLECREDPLQLTEVHH